MYLKHIIYMCTDRSLSLEVGTGFLGLIFDISSESFNPLGLFR